MDMRNDLWPPQREPYLDSYLIIILVNALTKQVLDDGLNGTTRQPTTDTTIRRTEPVKKILQSSMRDQLRSYRGRLC